MTLLVTGGAGFIGSNFVNDWFADSSETIVNLDALTYAGNLHNLDGLRGDGRHVFVQGDIGDRALVDKLLAEHRPRAIVNFAAESHVDRSIHGPGEFMRTNVLGTFGLLESTRAYWGGLRPDDQTAFPAPIPHEPFMLCDGPSRPVDVPYRHRPKLRRRHPH